MSSPPQNAVISASAATIADFAEQSFRCFTTDLIQYQSPYFRAGYRQCLMDTIEYFDQLKDSSLTSERQPREAACGLLPVDQKGLTSTSTDVRHPCCHRRQSLVVSSASSTTADSHITTTSYDGACDVGNDITPRHSLDRRSNVTDVNADRQHQPAAAAAAADVEESCFCNFPTDRAVCYSSAGSPQRRISTNCPQVNHRFSDTMPTGTTEITSALLKESGNTSFDSDSGMDCCSGSFSDASSLAYSPLMSSGTNIESHSFTSVFDDDVMPRRSPKATRPRTACSFPQPIPDDVCARDHHRRAYGYMVGPRDDTTHAQNWASRGRPETDSLESDIEAGAVYLARLADSDFRVATILDELFELMNEEEVYMTDSDSENDMQYKH